MEDTRLEKPILMMALQPNCVVRVSQYGDEWRMDIRHVQDYCKFNYGQDLRGCPVYFTKKGINMTLANTKTLLNNSRYIEEHLAMDVMTHINDNIYDG